MNQKWQPLRGAVDLHIHIGPDVLERYYDSIDLAMEALQAGMDGIVLKDQLCPSMFKAALTEKIVPDIKTFGSIVLNETCGGLSSRSVQYALKAGAKVVWLPTVDAKYCYQKGMSGHWIQRVNKRNAFGGVNPQYTVIDDTNECVNVVKEILGLVKEHNAILASGHISPQECIAVLEANKNIGANVIITHPNLWFDDFNVKNLKKMVELNATLELTMGGLSPNRGHGDLYEMIAVIQEVGYENCILATDAGSIDSPSPPQELRSFCYLLRSAGISENQVEIMVRDNTRRLVGLEDTITVDI